VSRCKHPEQDREYVLPKLGCHASEICHACCYVRTRVENPRYVKRYQPEHGLNRRKKWLIWGPWLSPGAQVRRALLERVGIEDHGPDHGEAEDPGAWSVDDGD
jgi:hypothetical protein